MKTTYSNVKNPKRLTWILGSVVIVGYVAFFAMIGIDHTGWQILRMVLYMIAIADIDRITRVTRVTNKKCKLRYLNIHEAGVRFVDVKLLPAQANALINHLVRINSDITVQSRNYI